METVNEREIMVSNASVLMSTSIRIDARCKTLLHSNELYGLNILHLFLDEILRENIHPKIVKIFLEEIRRL